MSYPFHEQIEELLEITIGEESSPSRPGGFPKAKKINLIQNLRMLGLKTLSEFLYEVFKLLSINILSKCPCEKGLIIIFTWWCRDFSGVWSGDDFKYFYVKNISFVVAIDEHVAAVSDGESVQDVLQSVKRDAAAVVSTLSLLDPGMKGELSLPDGRRTGKRSGLETDVEVRFEKGYLRKYLTFKSSVFSGKRNNNLKTWFK